MELPPSQRQQLREAERALEASIVKLAQKVGQLSEFEKRQMEVLRQKLQSVRFQLMEVVQVPKTLLIPIADPKAARDTSSKDARFGVA